MALKMGSKTEERRKQVMLGDLPDDFLRISSSPQQIAASQQIPLSVPCQGAGSFFPPNAMGRLSITIVQAHLAKNYGMTKMDPYVRIRVGHNVYETHADFRGGKNPNWNKTFHSYLPQGIKTISLEIFDERAIATDELIAWGTVALPEVIFRGEVADIWPQLSGRQGNDKEGSVNLVFSYAPMNSAPYAPAPVMVVPTPYYGGLPYYSSGHPIPANYHPGMQQRPMNPQVGPPVSQRPTISEEDVKQVQEMFPSFDREVILSVLENSRGNKDQAINVLLSMASES